MYVSGGNRSLSFCTNLPLVFFLSLSLMYDEMMTVMFESKHCFHCTNKANVAFHMTTSLSILASFT